MEKLQAAIEKARAQRDDVNRGITPRKNSKLPVKKTTSEAVDASWEALIPMDIRKSAIRRNRLVAANAGKEAAPFDMLRTRILQQAQTQNWRRIAVVSPHSGCGKTTTAANMIFGFERQKDLRTLVLDFDLRRFGLAKALGQKPAHNMADVLEGRVEFADHALRYGSNVAVGLNKGPVANPAELLQSQQTSRTLDALEAIYQPDIMLFDMPPLLASDDNFGFLKNVDAALLLAEAGRTAIDQIDVAERQLAELTNVMGIVLNKCRFSGGAYGYENSYG